MPIKISEIGKNVMWPLGIGVLAFLIRLLYLYQSQDNPIFYFPVLAAETMDQRAMEVLKGNWIGNQVFYHAPLYEYFLAFLYGVLGRDFFLVKLIQSLIGVVSALLIYLIGRRLFNSFTGIIAAMIYGFYGPAILLETELLYTGLSIFLYLLIVLFLIQFMEDRSLSKILYTGLFVGLGAINRTEVFLFIPMVIFWIAILFGTAQKKKALFSSLIFLIGVSIFIIPVTVRNYIVEKDFVLISYKSGLAFYIGNNPNSDGMTAYIPGTHSTGANVEYETIPRKIAEEKLGRSLKPSEVSNYWFGEALIHIWENPFASLNLFFKKGYLFWQGHEIDNNIQFYFFRQYSWILRGLIWKEGIAFPFGLLSPLGIIGMYLARKRWKALFPLYSLIFLYMFISVIGLASGRYRIPAIPFLMIFGSYSIFYFLQNLKKSKFQTMSVFLCCFLFLVFLLNYDFLGLTQISHNNKVVGYFNAGFALEKKGEEEEAIMMYRKGLKIVPEFPEIHYNLGLIHYRKDHLEEAQEEFLQAVKFSPTFTKSYILLGEISVKKKKWNDAVRFSRKGVIGRLAPPVMESFAYSNLGYAYFNLGDTDLAVESFKKSLTIDPSRADARLTLGFIYEKLGKVDFALLEYKEMLRYEPKNKMALYNLASLLDSSGRGKEAIKYYQKFLLLTGEKEESFKEKLAHSRIEELSSQY